MRHARHYTSLVPRRNERSTNEAGLSSGMVGVPYISSRYKKKHNRPKLDLEALHTQLTGTTFGFFTVTDRPFWRERRDRNHINYYFEAQCRCGKRVVFILHNVFRSDGSPARHQPNMCRECYRVMVKRRKR